MPDERRSLDRARLLALHLGISSVDRPLLTLVGSKGKGTAAAYASGYLSAVGARVITITSPSYRTNRERIRVDGLAISTAEMAGLSTRVADAVGRLPPPSPGSGYLAPSGLFILAGMLHASSVDADFIVLEAGRGGLSDEASLFPPTVAAITPIFEEHVGELGATITDIALDKASVIGAETKSVLSVPQRDEVAQVIRQVVANGNASLEFTTPHTSGLPRSLLPTGLGTVNAELGCGAAQRLLDLTTTGRPDEDAMRAILESIALPGRLSWHRLPGSETPFLLDQAVSRAGAATALTLARTRLGGLDHVLLCLSDDKDLNGVIAELADTNVTFVELNRPHLSFDRSVPPGWKRIKEDELTVGMLSQLGRRVLALGTFSFVALILNLLDAETESLFTRPHR